MTHCALCLRAPTLHCSKGALMVHASSGMYGQNEGTVLKKGMYWQTCQCSALGPAWIFGCSSVTWHLHPLHPPPHAIDTSSGPEAHYTGLCDLHITCCSKLSCHHQSGLMPWASLKSSANHGHRQEAKLVLGTALRINTPAGSFEVLRVFIAARCS